MVTSASLSRWSSGFDTRHSRFARGIVFLFGVWAYKFYRMAVCKLSQEQPQKTLSAEIRLHRDCDSRWVADSALEVK